MFKRKFDFNAKSIKNLFHKYIKNYLLKEKKNIFDISLRKIVAFQPSTFNRIGYQTDINDYRDLWKFSDVMQENRFADNVKFGLNNLITKKDYFLTDKLFSFFLKYTKSLGKVNLPINSLSRSLISLRFINNNFDKNIKILELGPGSGLLGMLLLKDGYSYDSYEVTKSFYIYQKITYFFFSKYFKIKYKTKNFEWYSIIKNPEILKKYDLIIANHMLNEMHPNSLNFILLNLRNDSKIFFEGAGYDLDGDQEKFLKNAEKNNFNLIYYRNLKIADIYFGVLSKMALKNREREREAISRIEFKSFPNFQKNLFFFSIRVFKFLFNYPLSSYFSLWRGRNFGNNFINNNINEKNFINNFKKLILKNKFNYVNDDDDFLKK